MNVFFVFFATLMGKDNKQMTQLIVKNVLMELNKYYV